MQLIVYNKKIDANVFTKISITRLIKRFCQKVSG